MAFVNKDLTNAYFCTIIYNLKQVSTGSALIRSECPGSTGDYIKYPEDCI